MREKATREYDIPGTTRRRAAAETLRDLGDDQRDAEVGCAPFERAEVIGDGLRQRAGVP